MSEKSAPIDVFDSFPCPKCGELNTDLWECAPRNTDETVLVDCDHCGEELLYTSRYTFEMTVEVPDRCAESGCNGVLGWYKCADCGARRR